MFQTSPCVQWLRIHILMQEAQFQLIPGPGRFHMREATKVVGHKYRSPMPCNKRNHLYEKPVSHS